ncbi:MAG: glycosyltransferase, partial [Chloroflexi bacterium]|nr:glycosyltransferase [Chloroflexota bacterium]
MSERGEWPTTPARTGEAVRARILLVVDSLDVGGAERHVVDLALALRHRYDVTVACSAGGVFAGELERAALPFVLLGQTPIKRRLSLSYARWLRRIVRQGDFDLVHAHCYASSCAAAGATVDTSVPLVLTEHTEGRWKGRAARLTSRRLFCQARLTIAVSASIRRALIDDYSVPPDRVRLIINAVPSVSQPVSELISLPEDWTARPVVGVVARLQPEKGVGIFLEAVARIAVERPDARYVVVGDGPLRMALKDQTSRLGLASRVSLLDFQRNARAILPAFDLLVVPSLTEGAPLIVLEAMAAGVPI